MPLPSMEAALARNVIATDWASQSNASSPIWGQQQASVSTDTPLKLRAGRWPRMDGNRYTNQPAVGLNAA